MSFLEHLLAPRRCLHCGISLTLQTLSSLSPPLLCDECSSRLPRLDGPVCSRCGVPLLSESGNCLSCRRQERSLATLAALYEYRGPAVSLVHGLKELGDLRTAAFLASEMVASPHLRRLLDRAKESCGGGLIVPVPASPRGRRRRGFDQAELLAGELARLTALRSRSLLSRRRGRSQKELDRGERSVNARAQLRYRRFPRIRSRWPLLSCAPVSGASVVLIDDVATTGETVEAASVLLLEAGAAEVSALVVARD
ncbi:MAG: ComF family protein [Alkalispirochaetaceae bacterium]